jgi:hypothetical protein
MKIRTEYKPSAEWMAVDDDSYDGAGPNILGWGATEQDAIADLLDRIIREQMIFAPAWKTLATGLVLGAIGGWIFPLVTGMGCIQ